MRLHVIGKLKTNNKIVAYKLFDCDTEQSKLIATKDVNKAIKSGLLIHELHYRINSKGIDVININPNVPNTQYIDTVDSNGNMISNNNCYVLLAIEGFEENRIFHVVNANCQKFKFNINDIKDKKIVGINQCEDSISIHTKYRYQLY